nr:unnamed protein product [Callosobruchus chinensis]
MAPLSHTPYATDLVRVTFSISRMERETTSEGLPPISQHDNKNVSNSGSIGGINVLVIPFHNNSPHQACPRLSQVGWLVSPVSNSVISKVLYWDFIGVEQDMFHNSRMSEKIKKYIMNTMETPVAAIEAESEFIMKANENLDQEVRQLNEQLDLCEKLLAKK